MAQQITTIAVKICSSCNSTLLTSNLIPRLKWKNLGKLDVSRYTTRIYYSNDSSSSPPSSVPRKPLNCRPMKEICGDEKNNEDESKSGNCPKNQRTTCQPVRPKCGPVKENKIKETIVEALPQIAEKIDYTKVTCPVSKFEKPSACPIPPVANNLADDTPTEIVTPIYPELPKPPCGPVVLCHCPPPPKLHPGDCPCASAIPDTQSAVPSEPCRTKFKYSCPEKRIFYCPPRRIILTTTARTTADEAIINKKKCVKS